MKTKTIKYNQIPLEESTLFNTVVKQGFLFRNSQLLQMKQQKFFQIRGNSFEIQTKSNKSKLIHFKDITAVHFVQSECKKIKKQVYYPFYFYYYNSSQVKCKYILYSCSEKSRVEWVTSFLDAKAQWSKLAKQHYHQQISLEDEMVEVVPEPRILKHVKRRPSHLLASTELQMGEDLDNNFQFSYA